MKKILILIFITFLLPGCAVFRTNAVQTPKVEIVKGQWLQLPTPEQLQFKRTATQILTGTYKIKNKPEIYTSQVQIEATPKKLVIVAVGGWGGEIFSIQYDGGAIKTSSLPMPNAAMGVDSVLTDFILTYASKELVEDMLDTTDIKLKIAKHKRIFMLNNKPIMTIQYQYGDPWKGQIILRNLVLHYKIKIKTVPNGNL